MAVTPVVLTASTGQDLVAALNDALFPLTNTLICGLEIDQIREGPYYKKNLYAAFTFNSVGGTPLAAPFQVQGFISSTEDQVVLLANQFIAANPTYFFSSIYISYVHYNPDPDQAVVGFIVYNVDGTAGLNWGEFKDLMPINVKLHGATGDGVTNDSDAINALIALGTPTNPIALYFPTGVYRVRYLTLGKNVHFYGPRSAILKLLENTAGVAHPFYCAGLDRGSYFYRNYYNLNDVVPGNTITLTNPADASQFIVNGYVVLVSNDYISSGGNDRQPVMAIINKVTAIDIVTGILTLQSPLYDAINGVKLAKESDYVPGYSNNIDNFCCESSIRGLTIDASDPTYPTQAFYLNGVYRCELYDLVIIGSNLGIALNGQCYSHWHDITWTDMVVRNGSTRAIEAKTGSYSSIFERLEFQNRAIATIALSPMEFGEYANRCIMRNIRVLFPYISIAYQYTIGFAGAPGIYCEISSIYFKCAAAEVAVSSSGARVEYPNVVGLVIRGVKFDCPQCARAVRITDGASGIMDFIIDDITLVYPVALPPFWGGPAAAILINTLNYTKGLRVTNVKSDGPLTWNVNDKLSTFVNPGLVLRDCIVRNIDMPNNVSSDNKAQPWQIGMCGIERMSNSSDAVNIRELGSYQEVDTIIPQTISEVTYDLSDFKSWCQGDAIDIAITGIMVGTQGLKNINVLINGVSYAAIAVSVTGGWSIRGTLKLWGYPVTGSVTGLIETRINNTWTSNQLQVSGLTSITISIVASIAVQPDKVRLYEKVIEPIFMYASKVGP